MALDLRVAQALVNLAVSLLDAGELVLEECARVFQQRDLLTYVWAAEIELVGELIQRVPWTLALERQDEWMVGRVAAHAGAGPPDAHGRALEPEARPDLLLELRQQVVTCNQVDANPRSDQ